MSFELYKQRIHEHKRALTMSLTALLAVSMLAFARVSEGNSSETIAQAALASACGIQTTEEGRFVDIKASTTTPGLTARASDSGRPTGNPVEFIEAHKGDDVAISPDSGTYPALEIKRSGETVAVCIETNRVYPEKASKTVAFIEPNDVLVTKLYQAPVREKQPPNTEVWDMSDFRQGRCQVSDYVPVDLANAIRKNAPPQLWKQLLAIAWSENRGYRNVNSETDDWGFTQIHYPVHQPGLDKLKIYDRNALLNPDNNIKAAMMVYNQARKSWSPWMGWRDVGCQDPAHVIITNSKEVSRGKIGSLE